MTGILRAALVTLFLAATIVVPFLIWGGTLDELLSVTSLLDWLRETRWAWAAGIGLIAADIFLPVPSKPVMAALGILYGPILGGALAAFGSVLAGCLGYGLCRALPKRWTERVIGSDGITHTTNLFDKWGFGLITLSRWLPVLPELVSFMAGFSRLSFARFFAALCCGSIPMGFLVASAGHLGRETPLLVLILSALVPVGLWFLLRRHLRAR